MRNHHSHLLIHITLLVSSVFLSAGFTFGAELELRSIDIGHAQLNIEVWESAIENPETIIALPGSGADITRFKLIAPLIADAGYRFIAVNQRGIAGSTGELEGLSLHDYASDIAAIIEALGLEEAHLLGWAMGNRIARAAATDFPQKAASISLIAAGGLVKPLTEPGDLGKLLGESDLSEIEKMELARRTLFSDRSSDAIVRDFVLGLRYWPEARRSQRQANGDTPLEQWWAGGTGPMLIVQGQDDKTAPPENGVRMKQQFADRITLVNLEAAGHAMGLERPEETAAAIISFLRQHPYASAN